VGLFSVALFPSFLKLPDERTIFSRQTCSEPAELFRIAGAPAPDGKIGLPRRKWLFIADDPG
jgi:hypothetical protein